MAARRTPGGEAGHEAPVRAVLLPRARATPRGRPALVA